ncbi:MAG: glycosyltransferase family 2 protein [Bacteroidetes bacterium]|nr:glycosyltransferase family 2 protein [Bacteroidota bacterium]
MKDQVFFSVIITTYNRSQLLLRALHSLIAQTETDWEAVIIDDGSIDHTKDTIKSFLSEKIHYYYQENSGDATAKNTGVSYSSGRFITFLDSDDYYEPEHLASRKKILLDNPNKELLHGGVRIIGNEYVPDMHNPENKIHLSECVIGASFFFKKEKFIELGGFEKIKYGSDAQLFAKAEKASVKILKTDIPTYVYDRTAEDSITHNMK